MAENKGAEAVDGIRFFLLFYVLFSAVFSALFGRAPKGSGYPLQVLAPRKKSSHCGLFTIIPHAESSEVFKWFS